MKQYEVGWRYYFFLVLFSAITILGIRVVYMLVNGEVSDNGEVMSNAMIVILSVPMSLILLTYAETSYILLRQLIKFNRCAVTLTQRGIENTLVYVNLFALVLVFPIKLIPWEAVKCFEAIDGKPYIRVNTKAVTAGRLTKIVLAIMGYHFCSSFIKPEVQNEDVTVYQHRFCTKNN